MSSCILSSPTLHDLRTLGFEFRIPFPQADLWSGNQLYAFLEQAFEAKPVDRHDTPGGEPGYMTIRIGASKEVSQLAAHSRYTFPMSILFIGAPWMLAHNRSKNQATLFMAIEWRQ
jgi:hypothetical protein